MSVIKEGDELTRMVAKMSKGNPGAIRVLVELATATVDGIANIFSLDLWEIYGADIYVLWSDICNKDLLKTVSVIRAARAGFQPISNLKEACSKQDYSGKELIDVDGLHDQFSNLYS